MNDSAINVPGKDEGVQYALQVAESSEQLAEAIVIDSQEMLDLAAETLVDIKTRIDELNERRLRITRPIDAAKKEVMDLFRPALERLEAVDKAIRQRVLAYTTEQERKRRAEREKLEAQQREEAARLQREADELQRQLEQDRKDLDEATLGERHQQLDEIRAQAETAEFAAPVPQTAAPKAAGLSTRDNWKHEVTNLRELVLGIADAVRAGDDSMLAYVQANGTAIGQTVKALKSRTRIPGVRVWNEGTLAVRSKK